MGTAGVAVRSSVVGVVLRHGRCRVAGLAVSTRWPVQVGCPVAVRGAARRQRAVELAVFRLALGGCRVRRSPAAVAAHRIHYRRVLACPPGRRSAAGSIPVVGQLRLGSQLGTVANQSTDPWLNGMHHRRPSPSVNRTLGRTGDNMTLTGGCFCGQLLYEVTAPLTNARSCHCSRCRKAFSGSGSAYAEIVPGSFRWVVGESALVRYEPAPGWALCFCGTCGSTLCGILNGEIHGVTLGCVDGDPKVEIEMHIFVGSRAPWDHVGGNAPQFIGRPDYWPPAPAGAA
jgi:hypothetical protein